MIELAREMNPDNDYFDLDIAQKLREALGDDE